MKSSFKYLSLLIMLFIFGCKTNFGQDIKNFEKIFEKEDLEIISKGQKKFRNISTLSYYPDTLPVWFFNPPKSDENLIYAIGISDPDMEPVKARELAKHRAEAMACINMKSKLQYIRDMYTNEQQEGKYSTYRQRFDTYFKVSTASLINDDCFSVVDTHFTRYNEYMVLIKFNPTLVQQTPSKILSVIGTVFYVEAQVKDAFEVQAEYELQSSFKSPQMSSQEAHYLYREKGNKFLTNSVYLGNLNEFPVYIYRYASPLWKENTVPFTSYNGLWSKFTQEFLRHLTLTTEESRKRIKNLGQQYNPENVTLSREVASMAASLKLNGIEFAQDTVKFDIQILEENAGIK